MHITNRINGKLQFNHSSTFDRAVMEKMDPSRS